MKKVLMFMIMLCACLGVKGQNVTSKFIKGGRQIEITNNTYNDVKISKVIAYNEKSKWSKAEHEVLYFPNLNKKLVSQTKGFSFSLPCPLPIIHNVKTYEYIEEEMIIPANSKRSFKYDRINIDLSKRTKLKVEYITIN